MLCDQCHQREASVFLTAIIEGHTNKTSLCEVCGAYLRELSSAPLPSVTDFRDKVIEAFVATDPRYTSQAYLFVVRSVEHAARSAPPGQHVTASAVAEAFRELALREIGTQALSTLAAWGISSCDDIGAIVFRLVEARLFGSRAEERASDFSGLYDFAAVFPASA